jgi:hypothetical protein
MPDEKFDKKPDKKPEGKLVVAGTMKGDTFIGYLKEPYGGDHVLLMYPVKVPRKKYKDWIILFNPEIVYLANEGEAKVYGKIMEEA